MEDMNILVHKGDFRNTQEKKTFELQMLILLDARDNGLNVDLRFLSHYQIILISLALPLPSHSKDHAFNLMLIKITFHF